MRPGDNEPSAAYADFFRDEFAREASACFETAVQNSGIDCQANAVLAAELHKLIKTYNDGSSRKKRWLWSLSGSIAVVVIWLLVLINSDDPSALNWVLFCLAAAGTVFLGIKAIPILKHLSEMLAELEAVIEEKRAVAEAQLAPLYNFFTWNTISQLIEKVMPDFKFDKFLSREREADMRENFDLEVPDNDNNTVLAANSGSFFGYPFILADIKDYEWVEKVWTGELEISWVERVRNSDGSYSRETRHETLRANIERPAPQFNRYAMCFFGHEAAPHLSFSRAPSMLSGMDGFFGGLGKKVKLGFLHRKEQNLSDDNQFTMMSNRDFEALFSAVDRDHEIEFRMLFTPLAQQYMVKLLNDKKHGYGDDFSFCKGGKAICLTPRHLNDIDVDDPPFFTHEFDLQKVRELFNERATEYFRTIYFTFAPLMAIPLYTEPRLEQEVCRLPENPAISRCELETAVNSIGTARFAHRESILDDILKIRNFRDHGTHVTATVCAVGFRGEDHLEYVSCLGGDGNWHDVPVPWVEYIPIQRDTEVRACHAGDLPADAECFCRRSIAVE